MTVLHSVGGLSGSSVSVHVHNAHLHGNLTLVDETRIGGGGDVRCRIQGLVLSHHAHAGHSGHAGHTHAGHAHAGHAHSITVELVLHQLRIDGDWHPLRIVIASRRRSGGSSTSRRYSVDGVDVVSVRSIAGWMGDRTRRVQRHSTRTGTDRKGRRSRALVVFGVGSDALLSWDRCCRATNAPGKGSSNGLVTVDRCDVTVAESVQVRRWWRRCLVRGRSHGIVGQAVSVVSVVGVVSVVSVVRHIGQPVGQLLQFGQAARGDRRSRLVVDGGGRRRWCGIGVLR